MHIHLRGADRRVSEQVSDHIDTGTGIGGIAAAGGYWLTYSNRMLSAWDTDGNRVDTTELLNAGTSFDAHFSFSYANGMVFIVDGPGGSWRGYDVGLGPS